MIPCILVTFPHVLYGLVWSDTAIVNHDIKRLIMIAGVTKFLQGCMVIGILSTYTPVFSYFIPKISLAIVGQVLNVSVYHKLGLTGVYYGNRFGLATPWVTSFPFNVVNNPQYTGCILTLMSIMCFYPYREIVYLCSYWIALYKTTEFIESFSKKKLCGYSKYKYDKSQ